MSRSRAPTTTSTAATSSSSTSIASRSSATASTSTSTATKASATTRTTRTRTTTTATAATTAPAKAPTTAAAASGTRARTTRTRAVTGDAAEGRDAKLKPRVVGGRTVAATATRAARGKAVTLPQQADEAQSVDNLTNAMEKTLQIQDHPAPEPEAESSTPTPAPRIPSSKSRSTTTTITTTARTQAPPPPPAPSKPLPARKPYLSSAAAATRKATTLASLKAGGEKIGEMGETARAGVRARTRTTSSSVGDQSGVVSRPSTSTTRLPAASSSSSINANTKAKASLNLGVKPRSSSSLKLSPKILPLPDPSAAFFLPPTSTSTPTPSKLSEDQLKDLKGRVRRNFEGLKEAVREGYKYSKEMEKERERERGEEDRRGKMTPVMMERGKKDSKVGDKDKENTPPRSDPSTTTPETPSTSPKPKQWSTPRITSTLEETLLIFRQLSCHLLVQQNEQERNGGNGGEIVPWEREREKGGDGWRAEVGEGVRWRVWVGKLGLDLGFYRHANTILAECVPLIRILLGSTDDLTAFPQGLRNTLHPQVPLSRLSGLNAGEKQILWNWVGLLWTGVFGIADAAGAGTSGAEKKSIIEAMLLPKVAVSEGRLHPLHFVDILEPTTYRPTVIRITSNLRKLAPSLTTPLPLPTELAPKHTQMFTLCYASVAMKGGSPSYENLWEILVTEGTKLIRRSEEDAGENGLEKQEREIRNVGVVVKMFDEAVGMVERVLGGKVEVDVVGGKGWTMFLDKWVNWSRAAGDLAVLDRVLALMAGPSQPSTTASDLADGLSKLSIHPQLAAQNLSISLAKLERLTAMLDAVSPDTEARLVADLQDKTHLSEIARNLGECGDDELNPALNKTARMLDRVRRRVVRVYELGVRSGKGDGAVVVASREWMVNAMEVVEKLLMERCTTAPYAESHADLTAFLLDIAMLVSKLSLNPKDPISSDTSLDQIRRAAAVFKASRSPPGELQDWARCLSNGAWSCAASLFRVERYGPTLLFVEVSIELSREALEHRQKAAQKMSPEMEKEWEALTAVMPSRWEVLSACLLKADRKEEAYRARLNGIKAHKERLLEVARQGNAQTVNDIFRSDDRMSSALARTSSLLMSESLLFSNLAQTPGEILFQILEPYPASAALIAEYLAASLEPVEHRAEVGTVMRSFWSVAIGRYDSSLYPIRKARCLVKLVNHYVATGVPCDDFDAHVQEAFELLAAPQMGHDLDLMQYKAQYEAELHMLTVARASTARELDADTKIKRHGGEARDILRSIVERVKADSPSKRRTKDQLVSSTAKMPVIDDISGFCVRLDRFVGRLSGQCSILFVIDFLRLKRGLIREMPNLQSDYVATSGRLGSEYTRLGKVNRAGSIFANAASVARKIPAGAMTIAHRVDFDLRYALYLATVGNITRSSELYTSAKEIGRPEPVAKTASSATRIRARSADLERAALANLVLAEIAHIQDNAAAMLRHRSIAFRLLTRSAETLSRLAPRLSMKVETPLEPSEDPFTAPKPADPPSVVVPLEDQQKVSAQSPFAGKHLGGLHIHIIRSLLETVLQVAIDHLRTGLAKDARCFAEQACDFANDIQSAFYLARAKCVLADVHLASGKYSEAQACAEAAVEAIKENDGPEVAEARRILVTVTARQLDTAEEPDELEVVEQAFVETQDALQVLEGSFAVSDNVAGTPQKANTNSPTSKTFRKKGSDNALFPMIRSRVLLEHARLLRLNGQVMASNTILEEARTLQENAFILSDEQHIVGTATLSKALHQFRSDLFLNSVTESTISMPLGTIHATPEDPLNMRDSIVETLQAAEIAFQKHITLRGNAGNIVDVRDASVNVALLRAYQASLGKNSKKYTRGAANLLDLTCSMTLRREMFDVLERLSRDTRKDEIEWPIAIPSKQIPAVPLPTSVDSDDEGDILQPTFSRVRQTLLPLSEELDMSRMPSNWCAISINVTEDLNTMFISRRQRDHEPVIFTLPLDRQGKREDDDATFGLREALAELRDIIKQSDQSSHAAKTIDNTDKAAKVAWWNLRKGLDKRMEEMLANIEFVWLGAFKTIFNPANGRSPSSLLRFRQTLEKIFAQALNHGDKNKNTRIRLDDTIVECFSTLSSKSREQEFEDLVYFILDLHQFNGVGVALAELDIDQLALDVQNALSTFEKSRRTESFLPDNGDEHIFLVLDRHVSEIPWESIPILRGRAVARVPSLGFLLDRIPAPSPPPVNLEPKSAPTLDNEGEPKHEEESGITDVDVDDLRITLNPHSVFVILNPSGDLIRTQKYFIDWVEGMMVRCGWEGIVGREPTGLEVKRALRRFDLVLYFGHGGMEQYISARSIKEMLGNTSNPSTGTGTCASVMIWGCSSGLLQDQGELDRVGNPCNYMLGGSPSLTAVLWDVTDIDIDKIAFSTFSQLHLDPEHCPPKSISTSTFTSSSLLPPLPKGAVSNVQAVAKARDCCKLRYLTGAGVVVWGVPVYLR